MEKMEQEQNSLVRILDAFAKVIITKDGPSYYNESGILIINLFEFLLGEELFGFNDEILAEYWRV